MAKRGNGEGSVRHNAQRGRWEARATVGIKPNGQPMRRMVTGSTKAETLKRLRELQDAIDAGQAPVRRDLSVATFLDWWAEGLAGTVAPRTETHYRDVIRLYINPHIGTRRLATLTPAHVSRMLRDLAEAGRSPNTQRLARSVLRRALRRAEADGLVSRNVAAIADGVKVGAPNGRTLTVDQARTLLAAADEDRLGAAFTVALTLGLRRGELLGLSWPDLDLDGDRPTVTITRSLKRISGGGLELSDTKTAGSRRRIHLPAQTVDALRRHRRRQAEERLQLGPAWPEAPLGHDLVFRTPLGTPVDPDNFRNMTYRLTKSAIGERWSPHELRHSAASLLIAQDVPLKIVSEVLGHSSIRITADVYGHLLEGAGAVAADAMDRALTS